MIHGDRKAYAAQVSRSRNPRNHCLVRDCLLSRRSLRGLRSAAGARMTYFAALSSADCASCCACFIASAGDC